MMKRTEPATMYQGGICFITDRTISSLSVEDQVKAVLDAGIRVIQYREKDFTRRQIYFQSESLRKVTAEYKAVLIINDHADIALAVDADGVHLGQDDLPLKDARKIMGKKLVGISTHDLEQAIDAQEGSADYIGFGPMFHTMTKDAGSPKGTKMLAEVRKNIQIPIVAIGGIDLENIDKVFKSGADAGAVASAILKSDDVYQAAKRFVDAVRGT
ncbi:MAG: thiamine phosphate synthase [bacterium]